MESEVASIDNVSRMSGGTLLGNKSRYVDGGGLFDASNIWPDIFAA
jgi:putative protein kinase ArgK-like GTPase of G3E family